jgi:acyl dehydratase
MAPNDNTPLIKAGETFEAQLRYTREQIIQFARLTGDANPLHHDRQAAERASFGEIIASGQQTASQMMGVVATHFSRRNDGVPREMLCLHFDFTFRAPIFAEQDIAIAWRVTEVELSAKRGGYMGRLEGTANVAGRPCVVSHGSILVTRTSSRLG